MKSWEMLTSGEDKYRTEQKRQWELTYSGIVIEHLCLLLLGESRVLALHSTAGDRAGEALGERAKAVAGHDVLVYGGLAADRADSANGDVAVDLGVVVVHDVLSDQGCRPGQLRESVEIVDEII